MQKYHSQYHCLANFWLLPMCIGRTGKKWNNYDSLDIFLYELEKEFSKWKEDIGYFERLKSYENFCEKHFIEGYKILSIDTVYEMYYRRLNNKPKTEEKFEEDSQNLVNQAYKFMESRAESISSNDNICGELYECFDELKNLY